MPSKYGLKFYREVMYALIDAERSQKELWAAVNDLRMLRGMPRVTYSYVNNMIRGLRPASKELLDAIENLCGVRIAAE